MTGGGFSLLTYATHAEGRLQQLLSSAEATGSAVHVGGWGEPWRHFMQKFEFVRDFAAQTPADHVVIFVDGFDTELRHPASEAARRFLHMRADFVVGGLGVETLVPALAIRRAFFCSQEPCGNSGMYVGYAHAVHALLTAALEEEDARGDDQRALGLARARLGAMAVKVDADCEIFLNLNARERTGKAELGKRDPVFVGYNGESWVRSRASFMRQASHFSSVLCSDALACMLVASLGLCWGSYSLPVPCGSAPSFALTVALVCVLSPGLTLRQTGLLFLLSVFAICHTCTRSAASCPPGA